MKMNMLLTIIIVLSLALYYILIFLFLKRKKSSSLQQEPNLITSNNSPELEAIEKHQPEVELENGPTLEKDLNNFYQDLMKQLPSESQEEIIEEIEDDNTEKISEIILKNQGDENFDYLLAWEIGKALEELSKKITSSIPDEKKIEIVDKKISSSDNDSLASKELLAEQILNFSKDLDDSSQSEALPSFDELTT